MSTLRNRILCWLLGHKGCERKYTRHMAIHPKLKGRRKGKRKRSRNTVMVQVARSQWYCARCGKPLTRIS